MRSLGPRGGVRVRVPAKVNLELAVGPVREDGYHDLATVFQAVSLYDEVAVAAAEDWSCEVTGPFAPLVPTGADNLAVRAARLVAEVAAGRGLAAGPVAIVIDKEIPVAGGMAGGSADAAAALVACAELWGLPLSHAELEALAARLGSDVAFLVRGGTALGTGRGERLTDVLASGEFHWVFAFSDEGLSTPAVYAECDRLREAAGTVVGPPEPSSALMAALRAGDAQALGRALSNDLQEAALSLRPGLRSVIDAGLEVGALGGIVSGSGPTVALLVADLECALDVSVALVAQGLVSRVAKATGPVAGATVLRAAGGASGQAQRGRT